MKCLGACGEKGWIKADGIFVCSVCKTPSPNNDKINKLIDIIIDKAKVVRTTATMNGEYGDGGASVLEDQIKFYQYGRDGIIPPEWEKKYGNQLDPEWDEYLRLKKKFGE